MLRKPFGRRVYTESKWELSRRVYFDTRFELDVDVDEDNDSTPMTYVDGGVTSDQDPPPGQADQMIKWDHFIKGAIDISDEQTWYLDFLIDVPEGDSTGTGRVTRATRILARLNFSM